MLKEEEALLQLFFLLYYDKPIQPELFLNMLKFFTENQFQV
jgi:hypothetical protein